MNNELAALDAREGPVSTGDSSKPLAIDLFCGLGGWAEGFLSEGYDVIGFDIERHDYGTGSYPGQLVLQDVLTLHGAQFKHADLIVASPPCQFFSRMAMPFKCPWDQEEFERRRNLALELFWACWRIQHEASEAAGRPTPLIVENVVGAQKWVGRSRFAFESFHLWGDIPALMPQGKGTKNGPVGGGSWFGISATNTVLGRNPDGKKIAHVGKQFDGQRVSCERNDPRDMLDGVKCGGSWFHGRYRKGQGPRNHGSKSTKRKAASAQIAKIPYPLAQHIARVFKPTPGPSPAMDREN